MTAGISTWLLSGQFPTTRAEGRHQTSVGTGIIDREGSEIVFEPALFKDFRDMYAMSRILTGDFRYISNKADAFLTEVMAAMYVFGYNTDPTTKQDFSGAKLEEKAMHILSRAAMGIDFQTGKGEWEKKLEGYRELGGFGGLGLGRTKRVPGAVGGSSSWNYVKNANEYYAMGKGQKREQFERGVARQKIEKAWDKDDTNAILQEMMNTYSSPQEAWKNLMLKKMDPHLARYKSLSKKQRILTGGD